VLLLLFLAVVWSGLVLGRVLAALRPERRRRPRLPPVSGGAVVVDLDQQR
jgi:hypothetical protein